MATPHPTPPISDFRQFVRTGSIIGIRVPCCADVQVPQLATGGLQWCGAASVRQNEIHKKSISSGPHIFASTGATAVYRLSLYGPEKINPRCKFNKSTNCCHAQMAVPALLADKHLFANSTTSGKPTITCAVYVHELQPRVSHNSSTSYSTNGDFSGMETMK